MRPKLTFLSMYNIIIIIIFFVKENSYKEKHLTHIVVDIGN